MSAQAVYSSPLDAAATFWDDHGLARDAPVIVGVSGGVDSMVLLDVLHRMEVDVQVVHVHYGLRPDADLDARFVAQAAVPQTGPVHIFHADPKPIVRTSGRSLQAVAREQRYRRLVAVARGEGSDTVAVAHHRDDQAETVLLNLLRGTGPEGLAGMAPTRPCPVCGVDDVRLVRPLLTVGRADIEAYARQNGIFWRDDPTNAVPKYRRNKIRHRVLPMLEAIQSGATSNIAQAAAHMRAYVDASLDPVLDTIWEHVARRASEGGTVRLSGIASLPAIWQMRVILRALRRFLPAAPATEATASATSALVQAQVGRRVELGGGVVWRERGHLRFVADSGEDPDPASETGLEPGVPVPTPDGRQVLVHPAGPCPDDMQTMGEDRVVLDADRVEAPLRVRRWRDGDRMQPLGMQGTKRVSDVLTDAHVPPHRRGTAWVVVDAVGRIVWVRGDGVSRIHHAVRVRDATERCVELAVTDEDEA